MLNKLLSRQPKLDGYLYHYTSQSGLLGIIREREIWATNLLFLNDSMELNYAIQLVKKKIENFKVDLPEIERKFIEDFDEALDEITSAFNQSFAGVYVCSFSKNANQLSQWRGYCPDGGGFSIGFDFNSSLIESVKAQGFTLAECIYNENKQAEIFEFFLEHIRTQFNETENYSPRGLAIREFLALAPRIKHPEFKEEQEWRLISIKSLPEIKFRAGKSKLVPYVSVSLDFQDKNKHDKRQALTCIPEICIGPTPDPYLSSVSLKTFLRAEQIFRAVEDDGRPKHHCFVALSNIPYRTW